MACCMSAASMNGKSSRIRSRVQPASTSPAKCSTAARCPRIHGWPPKFPGLNGHAIEDSRDRQA
jgi:hypothetical protein